MQTKAYDSAYHHTWLQPTYARLVVSHKHWNRSAKVKRMRLMKFRLSNLQRNAFNTYRELHEQLRLTFGSNEFPGRNGRAIPTYQLNSSPTSIVALSRDVRSPWKPVINICAMTTAHSSCSLVPRRPEMDIDESQERRGERVISVSSSDSGR